MKNNSKQEPKKKILEDYKKVGTKFLPPANHIMGPMKNVSYFRLTMPELVWWDVISQNASDQFAVDLAAEISKFFKEKQIKGSWWAFISDYSKLEDKDFEELKAHLHGLGMLVILQSSLSKFLDLYPACPLKKFSNSPNKEVDSEYLKKFENRVEILADKRSREGVLMQAQAIYMGFVLGKLHVVKGLALADFPEVSKYPKTPRSIEVGASICSTLNMLGAQALPEYKDNEWVQYFWKRSLEIRPMNWEHLING